MTLTYHSPKKFIERITKMSPQNKFRITKIRSAGAGGSLPVVEPTENLDPVEWVKANRELFEDFLSTQGGILLRGFDIHSLSEFNKFSQACSPALLEYTYRSTPRTRLGGKVYTATEYPADQHIAFHNENSYSKQWPSRINFFCLIAARRGGETPIADSRKVLSRIDKDIIESFKSKGVKYVRNYSSNIDLSWQEVFQTTNKSDVEEFCRANDIEFEWKDGPVELTTSQICQATTIHPKTKQEVWFNQAHLFSTKNLESTLREQLISELGEKNLPRGTYYGDGSHIEDSIIDHINAAYAQEQIVFKWQKGDIMALDNLLMAHGRNPYEGERKIAVTMG